jgi:hypothetical protein
VSELTFEQIESCLPEDLSCDDKGRLIATAQMFHTFARDIWELKAQPATEAQVSNEMVSAACMVWAVEMRGINYETMPDNQWRFIMRASLEAALAAED